MLHASFCKCCANLGLRLPCKKRHSKLASVVTELAPSVIKTVFWRVQNRCLSKYFLSNNLVKFHLPHKSGPCYSLSWYSRFYLSAHRKRSVFTFFFPSLSAFFSPKLSYLSNLNCWFWYSRFGITDNKGRLHCLHGTDQKSILKENSS